MILSKRREKVWNMWSGYQSRRSRVRRNPKYLALHTPCYECGEHLYKYSGSFPRCPESPYFNIHGERYWGFSYITPKCIGGNDDILNLRISCLKCVKERFDNFLPVMRAKINGNRSSLARKENIVRIPVGRARDYRVVVYTGFGIEHLL